jgi:hypothetical protein
LLLGPRLDLIEYESTIALVRAVIRALIAFPFWATYEESPSAEGQ